MKILASNWNNVLTDVLEELEKRGHEILEFDGKKKTAEEADVVIVWNETAIGGWRTWIKMMQEMGKKVILVQHGRRGTSRIYPPFNENLNSDIVCSWSQNDKKRLMSVGVDEKRIKVTGNTLFSHLKNREKHKGVNIVFSPEHWDKDVVENLIVADELRKLKGVNIITKTLRGEQNEELYDNVVSSDRNSPDHMKTVAEVLSKADLVVCISESTFELLAESMNIPVVVVDCWIPKSCDGDDRYKQYKHEYSNACTVVKLFDLNKTIMKELKSPDRLVKERRQIAIDDGGIDIASPLNEICAIIEGINR